MVTTSSAALCGTLSGMVVGGIAEKLPHIKRPIVGGFLFVLTGAHLYTKKLIKN